MSLPHDGHDPLRVVDVNERIRAQQHEIADLAWLHGSEPPAGMRAIPLVGPATTRTIGLVWLDRDPEPMLARALLDVTSGLDVELELSR